MNVLIKEILPDLFWPWLKTKFVLWSKSFLHSVNVVKVRQSYAKLSEKSLIWFKTYLHICLKKPFLAIKLKKAVYTMFKVRKVRISVYAKFEFPNFWVWVSTHPCSWDTGHVSLVWWHLLKKFKNIFFDLDKFQRK